MRPAQARQAISQQSVGGLRRTADVVANMQNHLVAGFRMHSLLDHILNSHPSLQRRLLSLLDKDVTHLQGTLNIVKSLRPIVAETLGASIADSLVNDWQQQHSHRSAIHFPLLRAWATAAGDPAAKICAWGQEGAPMGCAQI